MGYKAILGLSEIGVGVLLIVPRFDPQATFARLSAEELREDPGDRFVALVSRHLPSLLHHRGLVAAGLVVFGLAKLVAAAAMWEGREWGGYLLARDRGPAASLRSPPGRRLPDGRPCPAGHRQRGRADRAGAAVARIAVGT